MTGKIRFLLSKTFIAGIACPLAQKSVRKDECHCCIATNSGWVRWWEAQEECQEGRGSPHLLLATLRPKTLSRCKRFFSPVDLLVLRMGQMMGGQGGVPGGPAGPGGPPPDMASLLQVVPWLFQVPSLYLTDVNQAGQQLAQQMQQSNPELVEQLRRQMGGGTS